MSDLDNEILSMPDELTSLKSRADLLNIKYHPSISVEKLREKVNAAVTSDGSNQADASDDYAVSEPAAETDNQMRNRLKREANELVRIRVTCMNPNKTEWEGEIFTCGNSYVGSFTKFVPFNADDGWHVPRVIYNQMLDRQCQVFTTVTDSRGNSVRKGKLIREFAIEVLPPLTQDELQELAKKQALAQAID